MKNHNNYRRSGGPRWVMWGKFSTKICPKTYSRTLQSYGGLRKAVFCSKNFRSRGVYIAHWPLILTNPKYFLYLLPGEWGEVGYSNIGRMNVMNPGNLPTHPLFEKKINVDSFLKNTHYTLYVAIVIPPPGSLILWRWYRQFLLYFPWKFDISELSNESFSICWLNLVLSLMKLELLLTTDGLLNGLSRKQ